MEEKEKCVQAWAGFLDGRLLIADWRKAGSFSAARKRTLLADIWEAVLAFRADSARASCLLPPELLCWG